jgi:integrase/recombinase XerD
VDASNPPVQTLHRIRRFSVTAGFYRTCVLDSVLEPSTPSPCAALRCPPSHRPGFTHLQFEALLTAARESDNPCDFALVAMLGLQHCAYADARFGDADVRACSLTRSSGFLVRLL